MKHFLKSIIGFAGFSMVIYVILIFIWGITAPSWMKPNLNYALDSYGHMNSRIKELKTVRDIDILFLGSSHAYRGFDTRIYEGMGMKVFNLGSSAQSHIQTRVLVKRYLDQLNPKLIIYEVYPATFTMDGVESSLDIIANDENDIHSIEMALQLNHLKVYNTLIYGLFRDALNLNSSFVERKKKLNDHYISGGYVEKIKLKHFKPIHYPRKRWKFKDYQFEAFEEVISAIKSRNIKLVLVNAPITRTLYDSYTNNDDFDSLMMSYATYYNFNYLTSLDDSLHFFNSNHLNQYGVEIFNEKLIEMLDVKSLVSANVP